MPSSRQARSTRRAISPRLAMTILSSMGRFIRSRLFDYEERLTEFDRVAIGGHDRGDLASLVTLDLVHHLHRFDDAQHLAFLDLAADLDEGLRARRGGAVEGAYHRRGHDVLIGA